MNRLNQLTIKAYPPSFRRRYGDELAALAEDMRESRRITGNLLLGAVRMWIRPAIVDRTDRLQASVATTWVAWCAGFLIAPAVNRALLDPPTAGVTPTVWALLQASYWLFVAGWALALLGALPIGWRALGPAVRERSWNTLRPLRPAIVVGTLEAAGLVVLATTHPGGNQHPSGPVLAVGGLWLAGIAVLVGSLAVGAARSLELLRLPAQELCRPALLTVPVAIVLTAMTACSLAATVIAGHAELVGSIVPVAVALTVATLASLTALTSATRGLHTTRR